MAKLKVVKEPKIKPRNAGTLTESGFWSFIRSVLRRSSRYWKPIQQCRYSSRRPYKGSNKRQKFEYLCSSCGNYYPDKFISVDHQIPCGSLNKADDLPGFVERLFCESDNLCVLCDDCHKIKTAEDKLNLKTNKND